MLAPRLFSLPLLGLVCLASPPVATGDTAAHWRFEASDPAASTGPVLKAIDTAPALVPLSTQGPGRSFPSVLAHPAVPNHGAALLNGRGHFEAAHPPELPLDGTFTIEALVHRTRTHQESSYIVSRWGFTGREARSWGVGTAGGRGLPGVQARELFMNLSPDGRETVTVGSGLILEDGEDYYISVTFQAGAESGFIRFEVCNLSAAGSLQSTQRHHAIARLAAVDEPLRIGAFDNARSRWPGLLDEIRVSVGEIGDSRRLISGLPSAPTLSLAPVIAPSDLAILESIPWPFIGTIRPRPASEIAGSSWSIGGETLDREFTLYRHWRDHLGPLGAKHLRLQAGWARTEREKGVYDWAWLDEPVRDALAQGVAPWINVSYGNPIYPQGGGTGLHATAPASPEALAAWDRWLAAMVTRYRDEVTTWEIWNEPVGQISAEAYAELYLRSAKIIRGIQPDARLIAIAFAGIQLPYAETLLRVARDRDQLPLIDEISYHAYVYVPESHYPQVEALRSLIRRHDPRIIVRQGENGAPSVGGGFGAITGRPWTENSQAKWNLRRMLGDHGRDIPNSLFSIADMHYPNRINNKGLLLSTRPDRTVERPKLAYHAAQNVYSILDDSFALEPSASHRTDHPEPNRLQVFAYRHRRSGLGLATVWLGGREIAESNTLTPVSLTLENLSFVQPVWVDLRTGSVHAIPSSAWTASPGGQGVTFLDLPIYDSPILIASRADLPLAP